MHLTKLELNSQEFKWAKREWDFTYCVMPDSYLDRVLKGFGYPGWSQFNCEQFLRLQYPQTCSPALTQGNQLNDSVRNISGTKKILIYVRIYHQVCNLSFPRKFNS